MYREFIQKISSVWVWRKSFIQQRANSFYQFLKKNRWQVEKRIINFSCLLKKKKIKVYQKKFLIFPFSSLNKQNKKIHKMNFFIRTFPKGRIYIDFPILFCKKQYKAELSFFNSSDFWLTKQKTNFTNCKRYLVADSIKQKKRSKKPKLIFKNIWFQHFERSNQNTYFLQRPVFYPFNWLQKGDLSGDCSASNKGELALGKNLFVAYMPWEGFNFEDAVLINKKILSKYTSLHIEKYDLELDEQNGKKENFEQITRDIPGLAQEELQKLDENGIIKIGSWVTEGNILVGKIIPITPQPLLTHEKLLYDIVGQKTPKIKEKSLRVPQGVFGRIIRISYTLKDLKTQPVHDGDQAPQARSPLKPGTAGTEGTEGTEGASASASTAAPSVPASVSAAGGEAAAAPGSRPSGRRPPGLHTEGAKYFTPKVRKLPAADHQGPKAPQHLRCLLNLAEKTHLINTKIHTKPSSIRRRRFKSWMLCNKTLNFCKGFPVLSFLKKKHKFSGVKFCRFIRIYTRWYYGKDKIWFFKNYKVNFFFPIQQHLQSFSISVFRFSINKSKILKNFIYINQRNFVASRGHLIVNSLTKQLEMRKQSKTKQKAKFQKRKGLPLAAIKQVTPASRSASAERHPKAQPGTDAPLSRRDAPQVRPDAPLSRREGQAQAAAATFSRPFHDLFTTFSRPFHDLLAGWLAGWPAAPGKARPSGEPLPRQASPEGRDQLREAELSSASLVPSSARFSGEPTRSSSWSPNFRQSENFVNSIKKITIYIAEKREFQVGDKISGRHGNKGIISKILSDFDMPYLSNGSTLDVLLNPLGVPSRMNVGQLFECLLGFTGKIFHTKFQVLCFDEMYGYEASRSFIYSKLFEACKQSQQTWLFSKQKPGKFHLFDGRNGQLFDQAIFVGSTYLMKLIHIVDEKIHARATGPYSLITQQPLRGRAKHGGQRLGEMEVWALQGFGSAYTLQELLTVKSDDFQGRNKIMQTLLKNTSLKFGTPESLRVVLRELQCLCLDLQLFNDFKR